MDSTSASTALRMKNRIEHTLCTQYTGEALLQRLLHIITTTILQLSSILTTPMDSTSDGDENSGSTLQKEDLFALLQTACRSYISLLLMAGNVVRYNDFYQFHYHHLILPLFSSFDNTNDINSIVPPYDSAWVGTQQQQQQQQELAHPMDMNASTSSSGSGSLHAILQERLSTAQSHLNKDAIRIAYMNLALFYMRHYLPPKNNNNNTCLAPQGDHNIHDLYSYLYYTDAIQMSLRSLESCSTRHHTTLHTILLLVMALYNCNCCSNTGSNKSNNVANSNYALIGDYIRRIQYNLNDKANVAPAVASEQALKEKVDTIDALERIHKGDYSAAALKLRNVVIHISNRSTGKIATTGQTSVGAAGADNDVTTNDITTVEQLIQDENWDAMVLSPEDTILYATVLTLAVNLDSYVPSDTNEAMDAASNQTIHHSKNRSVGLSFLLDHPNMKSLLCERTPFVYDILVSYYMKSDYQRTYNLLQQHVFPILQYDLYLTQAPVNQSGATSSNKSHLQILQNMIRHKFIVLYWNVYVECPLVSMMESLGTGITGTGTVAEFEALIAQLLKNRFVIPRQPLGQDNSVMNFSMDTRYDYIHKKLIRTNHVHSDNIDTTTATAEQTQLYHTTLKYHRTSQRVLDDTYSMLIRVACIENNTIIHAPGGSSYNNKMRRGAAGYRAYQPQHPSIQNYEMNVELEQQHNVHSVDDDDYDNAMIHDGIDDGDDDDVMEMAHDTAMNPEDMY
jgi:hypothetical protein